MRRCIAILFSSPLFVTAQWVSVGVTGGVPLSPHSTSSGGGCVQAEFCGNNDFYAKPYEIGASVDFWLPLHFGMNVGQLYQRYHQDLTTGLIVPKGTGPIFGQRVGLTANSWMFPLLAEYRLPGKRLRPFAAAGATLRHLGAFTGQGEMLDVFLKPQPHAFRIDPDRPLDVAVTLGGGLRFSVGRIDVVPELRYLHWTAAYYQPVQDQLMLMMSVRLPGRR